MATTVRIPKVKAHCGAVAAYSFSTDSHKLGAWDSCAKLSYNNDGISHYRDEEKNFSDIFHNNGKAAFCHQCDDFPKRHGFHPSELIQKLDFVHERNKFHIALQFSDSDLSGHKCHKKQIRDGEMDARYGKPVLSFLSDYHPVSHFGDVPIRAIPDFGQDFSPLQVDAVTPADKDNQEDNKKYNRLFFSKSSYAYISSERGGCQSLPQYEYQ